MRGALACLVVVLLPVMAAAQTAPVLPAVTILLDHREDLELSPAQVEELQRLSREVVRDALQQRASATKAYAELRALLDQEPEQPIDVAKAEATIRDIQRLQGDEQVGLVRATEAALAKLTPEQRTKLVAVLGDEPSPVSSAPQTDVDAPVRDAAARGGGRAPQHHPPSHGHEHEHDWHGGHSGPRIYLGPGFWWDSWPYPLPPVAQAPPLVPAQPTYWYYCTSLNAYYPYVASCPEAWVLVPAAGP
jgi:Spy/CpxP family protein refolding chaperone